MEIQLHGIMKRCSPLPSIFLEIEVEHEYFVVILTEKDGKVHIFNVTDSDFQSNCNDLKQNRLIEVDGLLSSLLTTCTTIEEALNKIKETTI